MKKKKKFTPIPKKVEFEEEHFCKSKYISTYLICGDRNSSLFKEFTHERVEYNVFLCDEPLKGSKSIKIFKITLTFRFDKL
jgi:hypothetical protein